MNLKTYESKAMIRVFGALCSSALMTTLLACSTSSSTTSSASCPCDVGNSGMHFTIPCGQSECITLNGQAIGYRCDSNGATEDPAVCSTQPSTDSGVADSASVDSSLTDTGACSTSCQAPETCGGGGVDGFCGCTPKSCAQLQLCGHAQNDCNKAVDCPACDSSLFCRTDNHCQTPATTIVVIGNYRGGTFAINVDQHVPNLGIGLVSYQAMHVTISGAYASDVVGVLHAGYDTGTTVTGVPSAEFVDFRMPAVSPDAGPADSIVDDIPNMPASVHPTSSEIAQYFVTTLGGGTLLYHQCQYDAYTGTLSVSQAGTCN